MEQTEMYLERKFKMIFLTHKFVNLRKPEKNGIDL